MAFENFRYRLALRADYDGEFAGEIFTWVWSKLARGKARQAAEALHACERANRAELAEALREAGGVAIPNPLLIGPAVAIGIGAALTPLRVHQMVLSTGAASKGLRRFYQAKAKRFAPRADALYERLTHRHLEAFSAFRVRKV